MLSAPWLPVSSTTGFKGRPKMPPNALISSQAISCARLNSIPSAAAHPVMGIPPPKGIGSPSALAPLLIAPNIVPVNAAPAPTALLLRNPRRLESTVLVSLLFSAIVTFLSFDKKFYVNNLPTSTNLERVRIKESFQYVFRDLRYVIVITVMGQASRPRN